MQAKTGPSHQTNSQSSVLSAVFLSFINTVFLSFIHLGNHEDIKLKDAEL